MKLPCTINGQPAEIEIDGTVLNRGALSPTEAAVYLGVCEKTVWTLEKRKEIKKTSYGTFPLASLNAHLERESEAKGKR